MEDSNGGDGDGDGDGAIFRSQQDNAKQLISPTL